MENLKNIQYREEIDQLFRQMPVMTTAQFVKSVSLISGYEGLQLSNLINQLIRNGLVLLSDEYVTTKYAVEIVSGSDVPEIINSSLNGGQLRLENFVPKPFFKNCMDCYPLVLDLYPQSENFVLNRGLYQVSFVHRDKGLIYEIVRVPNNKEDTYRALLLKEAIAYRDSQFDIIRNYTRRIAVVETPECAQAIPYTGINIICVKDDASTKGYRVVEKRTDSVWRDIIPEHG